MHGAENYWATPIGWTILTVVQIVAVLIVVLLSVAMLIYFERKVFAGAQMRKGPNVVGPFGLLQSFADLGKFLIKEMLIPDGADKFLFMLAPVIINGAGPFQFIIDTGANTSCINQDLALSLGLPAGESRLIKIVRRPLESLLKSLQTIKFLSKLVSKSSSSAARFREAPRISAAERLSSG